MTGRTKTTVGATRVVLWAFSICMAVGFSGCKDKKAPVAPETPPEKASTPPQVEADENGGKSGCEGGDLEACVRKIEAVEKAGDEALLFRLAKQGCKQKHGAVCWKLAFLHLNGTGTAKDPSESVLAFDYSCELGYLDSCVDHALLIRDKTIESTPTEAADLLRHACKQGSLKGCMVRGVDLLQSDNAQDQEAGFNLLKQTCEKGNEGACDIVQTMNAEIAKLQEAARGERSGSPASASNETIEAVGISWTVKGDLARRLKLKSVRCDEPFRDKMMCHLTMEFPQGWSVRDGMAMATAYDREGVQTERMHVSPNRADVGGTVREKLRIETGTKRVLIGM